MQVLQSKIVRIIIWQFLTVALVFAQGKTYEGPDDPAGDKAAEREGYMNGNRVLLYFQNNTELAKWVPNVNAPLWSKWPNGPEGVRMLDGIGLLIAARVYLEQDTIPVTDLAEIQTRNDLDTLYYLQTSYREEMDVDPTGTVEWGIYPVFGYFNEASEHPAMSNRPNSWPTMGWPSQGDALKWPGEWNGRFGRGIMKADLETYFVANDAQDQEYLGPEDRVRYYPRPGVKIGDKRPEVTIQKGKPWGGLGLRIQQRGFQWNNPQAQDAIFWEYSIANISEYDLPEVAFGYWVDNGIGGEADDEIGFFDKKIDMAYSWDDDMTGRGGLRTGIMGFAYLESPGLPYDGIDNDDDGLIDEQRDNRAVEKIGPTEGIHDLEKFLDFYNLELDNLKEHWDADEDQDWEDGIDANGDGIYQLDEYAGDDVGLDGVGPGELNYTGPDEGECNHKPDFKEGVGCEPNFNATDVTESDMVGLTSFRLFPVPSHASSYRWFRGDKSMWEIIGNDSLVPYYGTISNLIETFASGPFPLFQGREERISMSELHSYDPLTGLESEEHSAPALFEQKRIVQVIYEKDYQFAQPPKMPTLQATAADGKVILTWDDIADTRTRDPFVGNVNDFEGYKLYRSTDKRFSDARIITDGFGDKKFMKPIFQCDLKDEKRGFTDFGLVNGMGYYLGDESGIVHHFVDSTVQNGRTYYYALVAYDFGAPNIGPGIAPSENRTTIDIDPETGAIRGTGQNVQIVTPHQQAAGYVPPSVETHESEGLLGSGQVTPQIIAEKSLQTGDQYKVKFTIDTLHTVTNYPHGLLYTNNGLIVYNVTKGNTVVFRETPDNYTYNNLVYDDTLDYWTFQTNQTISTDVFEGLRLKLNLPVETAQYDYERSGWLKGDAAIKIVQTEKESAYFPWDYEIVFTDDDSAYVGRVTSKTMRDEKNSRIRRTQLITEHPFPFYVLNKSFVDSTGAYEKMDLVVHDQNQNGVFDIPDDRVLVGPVTENDRWAGTAFIIDYSMIADSSALPVAGDVFRIFFQRPFWVSDSITFTVHPEGELDRQALEQTMEDIKVVPNPYVATNAMEQEVANPYLNQPRRIMFTHIPAQSTIKIFTMSGVLVDKIDVENSSDDGTAYWDLLTKEGLEVAAGIYLYHIKAEKTGKEKMGKFAIIK